MVLYEVARRGWMKHITGSAPAPRIVRPQIPSTPLATTATAAVADAPTRDVEDMDELDAFSPEETQAAQQVVDQVVSELTGDHSAPEFDAPDASSEPQPDLVLTLAPGAADGFSGDIKL
jgi:23S rRNA (guanosine2251-2'-O)-methyltransferase